MLAAAGFSADSAIEIDYLNEKARPSTPVPTRTEEIVDVDDNSESDTNDSDSDLSSSSSSSSSSSQAESVDVLEWERTQKKEVARKAILVNPYGMWTYHMFFFFNSSGPTGNKPDVPQKVKPARPIWSLQRGFRAGKGGKGKGKRKGL